MHLYRPDPGMVDPNDYIAPRNGFAMSFRDFIPHLMNVLDQLGLSLHARTNFIKWVVVYFYVFNFEPETYSYVVITWRFSLHTRTSPIVFSLRVKSLQPSTSASRLTHASLHDSFSSFEASLMTILAFLRALAKRKPTQSTGERSLDGQKIPKIQPSSVYWRRRFWKLRSI